MRPLAWVVFVAMTLLSLGGDVAIKVAGAGPTVRWGMFAIGAGAYAVGAFAWLYLLRQAPISVLGVLWPVAAAIALVLLGAVVFHEPIETRTWVGLGLGIVALGILSR